jgi:hypothetical protein
MALPASDTFTYTDGDLDVRNASWTQLNASAKVTVSGNKAAGAATGECGALWNADTFNNDQYSKAKPDDTQYSGVCVRAGQAGTSTFDCYVALWAVGGSLVYLQKANNGSRAGITSFGAPTYVAGASLELRISGTTLQVFYNGSQVGTDQTDSDLSSGSAGIYVLSGSAPKVDDWEGGNLGGAVAARPSGLMLLGVR